MKRALGIPALVLAALLLTACASGAGFNGSSADAPADGAQVRLQEGGAASGELAVPGTTSDRAVVTTGEVSITSSDPVGAASETVKLVTASGGRIDSRNESPDTETQPAQAHLVIRVPAEQLDAVLEQVEQLGTVNWVTLNASDVTQQKQDIDARITALQKSVDRLLELMSASADTGDLIEIESALSTRQSELDSLTAQRDGLDDQIDFSTVSVAFVSEGTIAEGGPANFWDALATGWNSLLVFLSGFVIFLGVILPWLLVLAIIAVIVLLIVRSARRRRSQRWADAEAPSFTQPSASAPPAATPAATASAPAPAPAPAPADNDDVQP